MPRFSAVANAPTRCSFYRHREGGIEGEGGSPNVDMGRERLYDRSLSPPGNTEAHGDDRWGTWGRTRRLPPSLYALITKTFFSIDFRYANRETKGPRGYELREGERDRDKECTLVASSFTLLA